MSTIAPEEPPVAVAFVEKMVEVWGEYPHMTEQLNDEFATAMLVTAMNILVQSNDPARVALLLMGLAHQIAPEPTAGHA